MTIKHPAIFGLLAGLAFLTPGLSVGLVVPATAVAASSEEGADPNLVKTGIIRSVDPVHHTLVLQDGMRFVTWQAPDVDVDLSGLTPGTRINIYYVVRNGTNMMTAYEFP